ncbi:hypothetical protein TPA0598_06_02500 [Streptomyces lydicamycinicus]|uniref:GH18 domain-containing protein n=1 Tax=Streptomyces lydicamycinicus TaxID=1546107 RepID=A0A0P4R9G0_9ACTN|nr:membrane protein [Streptomyces lydicamycinicus]GAO10085.1 hypothetical protein TPA0598_06_02500 [Streptomyces lydicamycinicus]
MRRRGTAKARPRWRRAVKWAAWTVAVLIVLPVTLAGTALRAQYAGEAAPEARTRGRDALWLGHAWVDGRRDASDVAALRRRIQGTGIRDLYVHAGPLERDGTLPPARDAYPRAGRLISAIHRALPSVRVHAWLGDRLVYEPGERGGLRLSDASARAAIVASARQVLAAGFAGVHLDLEPLRSGNADYLRLLDRLGPVVRGRGAVLSVAVHQIDPLPGLHSVSGALTGHRKWISQRFFGQVARRVDQIALMSYDTGLPAESLYGGYVAQQTRLALAATGPHTELLMGLPFFHTESIGHHASAETVRAAVRGIRLGLTREDPGRRRFGMALYVDFAATDEDWAAYGKGWGRRHRS